MSVPHPRSFYDLAKPELVRIEPAGYLPWEPERLIIRVSEALGSLRWVHRCGESQFPSDRPALAWLLLADRPVIGWQVVDCPTCAQILATGYGRDAVDDAMLATLRSASAAPWQVIAGRNIDAIVPLLQLFEPGDYEVSCTPHFPTDGRGRSLWQDGSPRLHAWPSAEWIYRSPTELDGPLGPSFLHPSQPVASIDPDRVEHYRRLIRRGERVGGIALPLVNGTSVLLDGHHRASAACLERRTVETLTIKPLRADGSIPPDRRCPQPHHHEEVHGLGARATDRERRALDVPAPEQPLPKIDLAAFDRAAAASPMIHHVAALRECGGGVTAEELGEALEHKDVGALETFFFALQALQRRRAVSLASELLADPAFAELAPEAERFLDAWGQADADAAGHTRAPRSGRTTDETSDRFDPRGGGSRDAERTDGR